MSFRRSTQTCSSSLLLWWLACGVGLWTACQATLVRDVRVHVYQPHRNSEFASALIVWDASALNGSQADYAVNLYFDDYLVTSELLFDPNIFLQLWEGPPFPVPSNNTHFSLTLRVPSLNYPSYPAFPGYVYSVTVSYTTDSGKKGESDPVHFDTSVLSPPPEVLATRLDRCSLVGENRTVTMEHVGNLVTVNTVDRELFHYKSDTHAIYRSSLDSRASEIVARLPSDLIPSALSYDWLGETIYLAGTNRTDKSFGTWKIVVVAGSLRRLFEKALDEEVQVVTMVMNPFTGHLYWTEHVPAGDDVKLCQLNLRDNVMATLESPSNLRLSPALALDSITDRLWVSDQSDGAILSCNVSTGTLDCLAEVNTSVLLNSIPKIESISVDELRVYWTSEEGVYQALREDPPSSLVALSLPPSHGYRLVGLSPGQQPWPAADPWQGYLPVVDPIDACLTPEYGENTDDPARPVAQLVAKTNSSLAVNWTVPQLTPSCQETVFSYPTLHYSLYVTHEMDPLPGFPLALLDNQYTVSDLSPYTDYVFEVEGRNRFTPTDTIVKYGAEAKLTTAEGVPEGMVENIVSFPYGPRHMFVAWERVPRNRLKGDESSQLFFADLETVVSNQTSQPHLDVTWGLEPSTNYTFHVVVNNGVFNSSVASVQTNSTWSRPPPPRLTSLGVEPVVSVTAESLTAVVDLSQAHQGIHQLYLELYPEDAPNETVTSPSVNCGNLPEISNPLFFELNLTNVSAVGAFTLRAVATYRPVEVPRLRLTLGPVTETSNAVPFVRADVPDAPTLSFLSDQSRLSWTVPYDNGSPVNRFFLLARNPEGMLAIVEKEVLETLNQTANLFEEFSFRPGEAYEITVVASNTIGNSSESNPILFADPMAEAVTIPFDPLLYIPIAVVGAAVAVILLLVMAFYLGYRYRKNRTHKEKKADVENKNNDLEKSVHEDAINVKTVISHSCEETADSSWQDKRLLSSLNPAKPKSSSHPYSTPSSTTYMPESPGGGSPLLPAPAGILQGKRRPPALCLLRGCDSLGSVYANSDTSTPVGPGSFHTPDHLLPEGIFTNRNISTPDSPMTVSSQLDKDEMTERSFTSESGSEH